MEQPADSPENSRPDGAEPATSRAEGGASASEHKEEERLDRKALIDAAKRGELARVKEIVEGIKTNGVDINYKDDFGWTALMSACVRHTEVALELLKVDGLDVNIQGFDRWTALMFACRHGLTEVVIELLKVDGLDANVQSRSEYTALALACDYGPADIALALLRDPRVDRHIIAVDRRVDSVGKNVLTLARNKGLTAVVTLIEAWDRGDERMPLVKVHHRYLHGDVAAEGAEAEAQAPHPPESAITKALVDKNLVHYMSRFLAP